MVSTREPAAPAREQAARVDVATAQRAALERWAVRIETWVGLAVLAVCCIYIFVQLQPRLLFLDTTAAGGDTGAHVWYPAFLRDHLLPHFRLAGWSWDYYAGFPAGQFYFPVPALLIVLLDVVLPYNVAFKLITGLGPLLLPVGAYVFARGIRAPRPAPALFALAGTAFLFFKDGGFGTIKFDHHIMGGTLTSTLAGEYSFTIALAFSLLFLGTFAAALDRERPKGLWLPAIFFAATIMSHLVVGVFAVYAGLVIWVLRRPLRTAGRVAAIVAVGGLLTAVWVLPLAATLGQTTDMRYEPVNLTLLPDGVVGTTGYFDWLFISEHWYLFLLGGFALAGGIWFRRRATLDVAVIGLIAGVVFYCWEGLRDVVGKAPAWNLRLLPFWYLSLYLLAALGAMEIVRLISRFIAWVAYGTEQLWVDHDARRNAAAARARPVAADATPTPQPSEQEANEGDLPAPNEASSPEPSDDADLAARSTFARAVTMAVVVAVLAAVALVRVDDTRSYLPYWAKYNYTGYEGGTVDDFTKKSYPELKAFMDTAASLPAGRLLWEGSSSIEAYGTPLALMLLPYFTNERIPTMEGLYYEAASTTPYHFMAAATLMTTPSNAVRGLPYRTIADFDLGVRYLQLMGVRYFAATSDEVKRRASANASLRQVATVPDLDGKPPSGWTIYRVADSPLVTGLDHQPVVVDDMHADPNWKCEGTSPPPKGTSAAELSAWECSAVPWFNDPSALDRPLTDGGPSSWQHASQARARALPKRDLPPVHVSNVRQSDESISFDVSRTGVPVMVKASYFPNWEADGAHGPWRATPNFMVVVPTSKHVTLTYGTTSAEWAGRVLTLVGIAGLALLVWWGWHAAVVDDPETNRRRWRRPTLRSSAPDVGAAS